MLNEMTQFKHTPAPWKLIDGWDENGKGCFPSVILHGTESQYRNTCGRNGITINCSHDQKVESLMANAKLIAAAPELLEALIECLEGVKELNGEYQDGWDDVIEKASLIIKKVNE